jgi:hypothetical protein
MGFFDWLFGQPKPQIPTVNSILPTVVIDEIKQGRLPHINADKLFVKRGEICHYADHAILMVEKKNRVYRTRNIGLSGPGLLKGDRYHHGSAITTSEEKIETEQYHGILYITNKRIIFTSKTVGFDKQYRYLSAVKPYSNGIELQYGSTIYSLIVPDGVIAYTVIQLLQ